MLESLSVRSPILAPCARPTWKHPSADHVWSLQTRSGHRPYWTALGVGRGAPVLKFLGRQTDILKAWIGGMVDPIAEQSLSQTTGAWVSIEVDRGARRAWQWQQVLYSSCDPRRHLRMDHVSKVVGQGPWPVLINALRWWVIRRGDQNCFFVCGDS